MPDEKRATILQVIRSPIAFGMIWFLFDFLLSAKERSFVLNCARSFN